MGGENKVWRDCLLGDVIELKRGYDLPRQYREAGNIPVISSSGPNGFHSQAKVEGPGVVTGRYGTIGEVYFVEHDFWPLNTTLYVRDFKGNDPRFISYFLQSIDFHSCSDKAAVPGVNRNHLHLLQVRVPPYESQLAIAGVLGALDEKIELNRRTTETLEAMARALFKSWFIDFDPVRAKTEGGTPTGMDSETAKLFPGEFVEAEAGPRPRGWAMTSVGELLSLEYGKALKEADRLPGSVLVYGSNGIIGYHAEALVNGPGIVVGRKGNPGTVEWAPSDFFVIDTAFYAVPKDPAMSTHFLRHALEALDLPRLSADSAVPGINRNAIYAQSVGRPPDSVIQIFDRFAEKWSRAVATLDRQSRTLSNLRDSLLPPLLSGALSVPDAERRAQEVA